MHTFRVVTYRPGQRNDGQAPRRTVVRARDRRQARTIAEERFRAEHGIGTSVFISSEVAEVS